MNLASNTTRPLSTTAWKRILRGDPCAYCGQPAECVDHIQPQHRNVADDHTNLTGACQACNRAKGGDTLLTMLHGERIGHGRTTRKTGGLPLSHPSRVSPFRPAR